MNFADKSTQTIQEIKDEIEKLQLTPNNLMQEPSSECRSYEDKSTETIQEEFLNKIPDIHKSNTSLSIKTYESFQDSPTPLALLSGRKNLNKEINILETPPSLLELLYLEQIRKKNLEKK